MANELKIDFDLLTNTINAYSTLISDLENVKNQANTAIKILESTKWKSAASEAFFSTYSTNWTVAFDEQIKSMDFLKEQLEAAREEYEDLYEEIDQIANAVRSAY